MKRVLVIGGGAAGWLAACHLGKALRAADSDAEVTLIESPDIPTIGVGEGTVPAMRHTLEYLGIRETDFIRECGATFKQGIEFRNWLRPVEALSTHAYHHVFDYARRDDIDLAPYWLLGDAGDRSWVDTVSVQGRICDAGLAPKLITHAEYDGAVNYAYHLDAAAFSRLLTRHATTALGVRHLLGTVRECHVAGSGQVTGVDTDRHGRLEADLYVDCTGFSAALLGNKLGVEFVDQGHVLLADRAIAIQVPYDRPDTPIASMTIATALEHGWVWDIGLQARRGTGYVYSSRHVDDETAERAFRAYLRDSIGDEADRLDARLIPMQVGFRRQFWHGNCVAIGLSQGFVEPLEATGLLLFDASARLLASQFPPSAAAMPAIAERFNRRMREAWEGVIDFIKLHYCISDRDDSEFWRDNGAAVSIPDSLQQRLDLWRQQPPSDYDFERREDPFNLDNYRYVLFGMHYPVDLEASRYRYADGARAREVASDMARAADHALTTLPANRALLERIERYGLQPL